MKKLLSLSILSILLLSACSGPLADNTLKKENNMEEKTNKFAKRFSEKLGHTDLAAKYRYAVLKTNMGDIKIEFFSDESPITVNNFMNLAKNDFYDGVRFHRVIADFMIQGGDPNSRKEDRSTHGMGGPEYAFADEFNDITLVRGNLAMANSGPNTNGSQFFIVTAPATPWLDGKHTNFGKVVEGMEIVDKIEGVETDGRDNPVNPVIIEDVELLK